MSLNSILSMIFICTIIIGGFIYLLIKAAKAEKKGHPN